LSAWVLTTGEAGANPPGGSPPGLQVPGQAGGGLPGGSAAGGGDLETQGAPVALPDRILLKRKPGVSDERLQGIIRGQGGEAVSRIPQIDVLEIKVPAHARDTVLRALQRNPNIQFAEPVYLVEPGEVIPNDPRYGNAWHLPKIDAPTAWTASRGDGIVVAVLDTGIEASHPDFAGQLVQGWNSASQNDDISDIHGHGTLVAGTVGAATDNAIGVAAVGWNTMIMPIRVTNRSDGWATTTDMARGLSWAADNGAHIANMSYLIWQFSTVQNAAKYMRDRGGMVFSGAGNDGTDPGYTGTPHIVVVSATNSSDSRTSWSNYGAFVDLAAPGASIQTTRTGARYASANGTSFSSPVAAAVAALVMAANSQLTPAQVEQILFDSADDLGAAGWDPYYGWGRVNAGNAVMMAWSGEIDRTPPEVWIASPSEGTTVEGEVLVRIDATDDLEVAEVTLRADGQVVGSAIMAPFEFVWDTTQVAEGTVDLYAEARDAAGNVGVHSVNVTVEHATTDDGNTDDDGTVDDGTTDDGNTDDDGTVDDGTADDSTTVTLSLTGSSENDGRTWTAVVTLSGSEGAATIGSWDHGRNNVGGCTIRESSTSCSFSLSGIRKNIGEVTYTDNVNALSVTVGKP
jgi:hypothetical protein